MPLLERSVDGSYFDADIVEMMHTVEIQDVIMVVVLPKDIDVHGYAWQPWESSQ
jgi:hypothetical protein